MAISAEVLESLNEGVGGLSQVGKFLTVYPLDDDQVVRLARELDAATDGLEGPSVPFDVQLRPGSLVHYRFGSFSGRTLQFPGGEITDVIVDPQGEPFPEDRSAAAPAWAADPFARAGVARPRAKSIGGRYALVSTLYRSPRGSVHLAVDVEGGRSCIVKEARRGARSRTDGGDARDRSRHEAEVLKRLEPDPRFPRVLDVQELDGDVFLILEHLEGTPLATAVASELRYGRLPSIRLVGRCREAASMLEAVHDRGFVYRDMNSSNVLVTDEGMKLVDFELACEIGSSPDDVAGTPGSMSPQQLAGDPASIADDVYGLGALLYLLATGADPVDAPDPGDLLTRPIPSMNPSLDPRLAEVIGRCLDPDPRARFSTPMEAADAMEAAAPSRRRQRTEAEDEEEHPSFRDLAAAIGAGLDSAGPDRDLGSGLAGDVLALSELVACGASRDRDALARTARRLDAAPSLADPPLVGLYAGEMGISVALLRAGRVLSDDSLVASATRRARMVADEPFRSPDLYVGAAGRIRGHRLWAEITGDHAHLEPAAAAAEWLLEVVEEAGDGAIRWRIPAGFPSSGSAFLGMAHGAAGIGDSLLDVFEHTADERLADAARAAGAWIARSAIPALDDGSGLAWPMVEGGPSTGAAWCHGATGIGGFMLHAARLDVWPEAAEFSSRAARTTALGPRSLGPTRCHGLAGSIGFLLDMSTHTGDGSWLDRARALAHLLAAFRVEHDGERVWVEDASTPLASGYLTGAAGLAMCFLRLADEGARSPGDQASSAAEAAR